MSALGALNTGTIYALSVGPRSEVHVVWKKGPPLLRHPVVCAPAVAEGKVVFGDGMHQTDGATLYCLEEKTGRALWELSVPGTLVHLEGSPTISDGRVFIGAGSAGVLCVTMERLELEGQPITLEGARQVLDARWKALVAQYEAEKKKDPDFAIPPTEDMLPRPSPKLLWQAGKDKLHVDSPVVVVEGRVLAGSAYLDAERTGDRALICLDAADGSTKWRVPLALNPWAGPTVIGRTAVVGCSSIRFEVKETASARGQVVAVELDSGRTKWVVDIPGGVIGPVAARGELAVFTATDGKVRALRLENGQEVWSYDAGAGMFAGPAIDAYRAYVGDLKGIVHAIGLNDGRRQWALDLADDAAAGTRGMIYGSPLLHGGRLYVATCNIDRATEKTAVVCIGGK